jgi:hypothetical protein
MDDMGRRVLNTVRLSLLTDNERTIYARLVHAGRVFLTALAFSHAYFALVFRDVRNYMKLLQHRDP